MNIAREETEHQKMMDEVAAIFQKHGYKNLGYQQSLMNDELLRFVRDRTCIDVVTDHKMDDETFELVMQFEDQEGEP